MIDHRFMVKIFQGSYVPDLVRSITCCWVKTPCNNLHESKDVFFLGWICTMQILRNLSQRQARSQMV